MGLFKPNVEKMEKGKDVKGLIKALKHKDYLIRLRATGALGNIGDKRAVEPLIQALNDKGAVEPLTRAIDDEPRAIRRVAVVSLGNIGDKGAVEPLIKLLKDEDALLQEETAKVIEQWGRTENTERYIKTLKEKHSNIRLEILESLGKIGDVRAVEPIVGLLKDENVDVSMRMCAAEALGNIGGAKAVEPLIQALKEWNVNIRMRAAVALGKIGDVRAVEPLIKVLNDEKKQQAAEALGLIGDLRAAEAIINWLFMSGFYYHEVPDTITATMRNLFGDYTDLILKACIRGKQVQHGDADNGGYNYDLHESDEVIRKLCTIYTRISSNILHKVSQKKDIEVLFSWTCVSDHYGTLSFESQRDMAKKELERRGNPPYDPSAYLNKEAWKL